jgi:hypothetical protein
MNIRRNRLRYGFGPPVGTALERGELVVQTGGGQPRLWVGLGGGGLAKFDGSVETAGSVGSVERGGIVYADDQQSTGTTILLLRTPVQFTLDRLSAKTGSGTCSITIIGGAVTYNDYTLSASGSTSNVLFDPETAPKIPAGSQISMTVSNSVNLTSLVVQLDWLEG